MLVMDVEGVMFESLGAVGPLYLGSQPICRGGASSLIFTKLIEIYTFN